MTKPKTTKEKKRIDWSETKELFLLRALVCRLYSLGIVREHPLWDAASQLFPLVFEHYYDGTKTFQELRQDVAVMFNSYRSKLMPHKMRLIAKAGLSDTALSEKGLKPIKFAQLVSELVKNNLIVGEK